jgi:hypothetical protein
VIDGVGHLLHIQRPRPVAQAISEFLRRNPMTDGSRAHLDVPVDDR